MIWSQGLSASATAEWVTQKRRITFQLRGGSSSQWQRFIVYPEETALLNISTLIFPPWDQLIGKTRVGVTFFKLVRHSDVCVCVCPFSWISQCRTQMMKTWRSPGKKKKAQNCASLIWIVTSVCVCTFAYLEASAWQLIWKKSLNCTIILIGFKFLQLCLLYTTTMN